LKSDTNNGHFTLRPNYMYDNLTTVISEWYFGQKITVYVQEHFCRVIKLNSLCDKMAKEARQATDDNMNQAHCMLDTYGYKHTLRECNTYSSSTATMTTRTCLHFTLHVYRPSSTNIAHMNVRPVHAWYVTEFLAPLCRHYSTNAPQSHISKTYS
jgi:hypothetical protein